MLVNHMSDDIPLFFANIATLLFSNHNHILTYQKAYDIITADKTAIMTTVNMKSGLSHRE
jgi:hypothetical protein